jgi:hypothetical protein
MHLIKQEIAIEVYDSESELNEEDKILLQLARESMEQAYAPYSRFLVGCVLQLENNTLVKGNNQENMAYPSGLCAERVAIFYAGANYPGVPVKTMAIVARAKDYKIETPIVISSTIPIDHSLKSEEKVLSLCKAVGATMYINAIGGQHLYSKDRFAAHKIQLQFIKSDMIQYSQFNNKFIPWLSIIDVMMFNSVEDIKKYLNSYTLI